MSEKAKAGAKKRIRRVVKYVRVKQRTPPELILGPMVRVAHADSIFDDTLMIGSHKIDLRVSKPEMLTQDSDSPEIVKLPPERKRKPTVKKAAPKKAPTKQTRAKKKMDGEVPSNEFEDVQFEEEIEPIQAPGAATGKIKPNDSLASINSILEACIVTIEDDEDETVKREKKKVVKSQRRWSDDEPPAFVPKRVDIDVDQDYEEFPALSDQFDDFEEGYDAETERRMLGMARPKGFHIDFVPPAHCDVEAELRKYDINELLERIKAT